jgi:predicted ATPase
MTIKTLSIQGYRSIQKLHLNMDKINVVTGANGSGKSNLYKSVYLLAKAARGELAKTLALEGGMPSILWAGKKKQITNPTYSLRLSITQTDDLNYEIACGLPPPSSSVFRLDPLIKEEYIWMGESRRPSNTLLERKIASAWITDAAGERMVYPVSLSQSESVLSQLQEPHRYPEVFALSCEMRQWRFYHNFRTDADSPIRAPQVGVRTNILSNDGYDLAAALETIIEIGDKQLLYAMVDRAFPGAQLLISVDGKTRFEILLHMPGIRRPLEAREFSDGCLRYLCWLAALLSPRPACLLALNEPEMSLHTELLQPLAELITLAARYSQIWVTTHSQELAKMISKASKKDSINLINTDLGTQIEGIKIYEQFF